MSVLFVISRWFFLKMHTKWCTQKFLTGEGNLKKNKYWIDTGLGLKNKLGAF